MGRVPSRGSDQFVVRFPEGLRDRIRKAADANGRSMNAEIIARLEKSLQDDDQFIPNELTSEVNSLRDQIDRVSAVQERATKIMEAIAKYLGEAAGPNKAQAAVDLAKLLSSQDDDALFGGMRDLGSE